MAKEQTYTTKQTWWKILKARMSDDVLNLFHCWNNLWKKITELFLDWFSFSDFKIMWPFTHGFQCVCYEIFFALWENDFLPLAGEHSEDSFCLVFSGYERQRWSYGYWRTLVPITGWTWSRKGPFGADKDGYSLLQGSYRDWLKCVHAMVSTALQSQVHCRNKYLSVTRTLKKKRGQKKKLENWKTVFSLSTALGSSGKLLKGCSVW